MSRYLLLIALLVTASGAPAQPASPSTASGSWPLVVPGHKAPAPGEHPRLFFRKSDVAGLRAKAQTPEGKAMIARLKATLGGGEAMPAAKRPAEAPFGDKSAAIEQPPGAYTIGHAAGFGLLYQLTGDKKYADLGRQCFEWAFEGVRDRDDKGRYGWKGSSGALRAGPSLGWYAVGYDLCYEGWDDATRQKIAAAIANYNEGPNTSLAELAKGSRHMPGSNHWGMQVGGGALAALAIMNDPGVDMAKLGPILEDSKKAMVRNLTEGFGDGGFFAEGDGTGSMSSHIVFLPALQAWRTASGLDFITPRPNAQWAALKWPFLTLVKDAKPVFQPQRGGYPHNIWDREGLSGAGYFAYGFGAIRDELKPGLLWYYNHFFKEADTRAGAPNDTVSVYPQVSALAFINWPIGLAEKNPTGVWPHAYRDSKWLFYAWRNRWQDENDVVISILTRSAKGFMGANGETTLSILTGGKVQRWGGVQRGFAGEFAPAKDGSTIMTTGDGSSLAIDFSGASGCDALLAMSGPTAPAENAVDVGGRKVALLFLGKAPAPTPQVQGDKIVIGKQTIGFDGDKLTLAVFGR
jgi:hypothetical protein